MSTQAGHLISVSFSRKPIEWLSYKENVVSEFSVNFIVRAESSIQAFLAELERALEDLSTDDIWWSPSESLKSIGGLLSDLNQDIQLWVRSENLRSGRREHLREHLIGFDVQQTFKADVTRLTKHTLSEASSVLAEIPPAALSETYVILNEPVHVVNAIFRVMLNLSETIGQIKVISEIIKTKRSRPFDKLRSNS